jgi:tRNA A37 threonylcarbamoyladenosine synthetase subunit TsaC/SUA5/YrdC
MASTVVLCTGPEPIIIREGAVPAEQIMTSAMSGVA